MRRKRFTEEQIIGILKEAARPADPAERAVVVGLRLGCARERAAGAPAGRGR